MNLYDKKVLKEILDAGKPVLIYGNAQYAIETCIFLQKNNVLVESFVVDAFVDIVKEKIEGVPVRRISTYVTDLENYIIVIGFCNIEKSRVLLGLEKLLRCKVYRIWEPVVFCDWDDTFWKSHEKEFENVYNFLYDEKSKKVLKALIESRRRGEVSNLLFLSEDRQYFNELTYEVESEEEIFMDCGAFNGDTIEKYDSFTSRKYKKIYAFEPCRENMLLLKEKVNKMHNVVLINKGTWNCNAELSFVNSSSNSQIDDNGEERIAVTSIDDVLKGEKVTFIKMDVEGSEWQSLQGAIGTLQKWMPKLAICVYHKADDIIKIIDFLKDIKNSEKQYRFFLRHHSNAAYETVLYAIPVNKSYKIQK